MEKENSFNLQPKWAEARRKLNIHRILEICKDNSPESLQKLVSKIEFETGLAEKNVNSILKILYDNEKISIEDNQVTYIEGGAD